MTSPNSTFTEMVSTTLREHPKEITDNVSRHNALYRRLMKRGKLKTIDGGYEIVRPLDYAENSTYQRYSGYDQLNPQASDVISAAKYDWKQAAVHVVASGLELRQNSGKARLIDLAAARTKNAMRTLANNFSIDLYSAGSLTNQIGGLAAIITTDGTGTIGGINSSTYAFWANQFQSYSTQTTTTVQSNMETLWLACVRGTDAPDMCVLEKTLYQKYWGSLTANQRYTKQDGAANVGFSGGENALQFNTADVFFEGTSAGITTKYGYFLNTDYIEVVAHKDANMTTLDEKVSVNQDAVVVPIIFQGNLVCSNRALQGLIYG